MMEIKKLRKTHKDKVEVRKREKERIARYREFIKTNFDWDYDFILELLKFKIKMVRECISRNKIIIKEESDQITSEIKTVENLLQRVIEDNYYAELIREFNTKYGKIKYKFIKDTKSENYILKSDYKKIPKNKLAAALKEHGKLYTKAFELRKQDLKKAFDLMVENIWNWWD
jgi:hypothetical protein